jgi:serine/threonine protein kinase
VQLSDSVDNDLAPLPDASDEVLKYLSKRSPGVTGNAWFIRTRRNGDKIFGFGPDVGIKHLPSTQLGTLTLVNKRLGSGGFGTVSEAILLEFDKSRSRKKDLDPDPCGYERPDVVVKRGKRDDSFFGGGIQHLLEPGGWVPKVYKDLWIPPSSEYPKGESLVVMQRMAEDGWSLLSRYPAALSAKKSWAPKFNRLIMIQDLVAGLKYAHENKIIHMDVKLENLMQKIPNPTDRYYRFQVIDWDLATDLTKRQTSWPGKGTVMFMAPGKTITPTATDDRKLTLTKP